MSAWALKKVWPEITLHIVPDAGHSSRELGITKLLVEVRHSPSPARPLAQLNVRPSISESLVSLHQATDKFADL